MWSAAAGHPSPTYWVSALHPPTKAEEGGGSGRGQRAVPQELLGVGHEVGGHEGHARGRMIRGAPAASSW
jgi:hypothetical protein